VLQGPTLIKNTPRAIPWAIRTAGILIRILEEAILQFALLFASCSSPSLPPLSDPRRTREDSPIRCSFLFRSQQTSTSEYYSVSAEYMFLGECSSLRHMFPLLPSRGACDTALTSTTRDSSFKKLIHCQASAQSLSLSLSPYSLRTFRGEKSLPRNPVTFPPTYKHLSHFSVLLENTYLKNRGVQSVFIARRSTVITSCYRAQRLSTITRHFTRARHGLGLFCN
jgi:hypothetical protein